MIYEVIPIKFLVELLEFQDYRGLVSGSAQPKITQAALSKLLLNKPPQEEMVLISEIVKSSDEKLNSELDKLSKLRSLKIGLMEDLLSGKVSTKDMRAVA